MSSVDERIKREARLFKQEIDAAEKRRLERLRDLLYSEVRNMRTRCVSNGIAAEDISSWLHGKSYDETYHDYAAEAKQFRTRQRIQSLLALCGGDEKLLLAEYTKVLDGSFPVSSPYFSWGPRLYRPGLNQLTVVHSWKRFPSEG